MANSNGPRRPAAGHYPAGQARPGEAGAHDPNYGQWPEQHPQSYQQSHQDQQQSGLAAYQNPAPDQGYPQHHGHAAPADPAHGQGTPLAPQFGAYDPAANTAQANPQPQYDPTPVTGEAYPQNYGGAGGGFQDPAQQTDFHSGANPAFPHADQNHFGQPAPAQHHADAHGFGAGGYGTDPNPHSDPYTTNDPTTGSPQDPAFGTDPYAGQNYGYPDDPNTQPAGTRPGEGLAHAGLDEHDYADAYDTDERGGGRGRMMMIAGALVGAIVVGGGLAYGWKTISGGGPGAKSGQPPVVGASPSKKRPANPGGRTFDHTDSKIMGRLGERGGTSTANGGSRKVVTVPVTRDGRIPGQGTAGAKPADDVVSVPGLTVVDAFGNAGRAPSAGNVTVTQPVQKQGAAPTTGTAKKPVVITRRTTPTTTGNPPPAATGTTRTVTATPTKPATTTTSPATTAQPPARKPKSSTSTTARTTPPSQPATPAATGGNGYVAVLASVPVSASSRMNALAQYADLQQKYGAVLANKTPDVREANLGTRGKYHRLLVGPPASRAQASALCSKLKAAGYSGCWVTAY